MRTTEINIERKALFDCVANLKIGKSRSFDSSIFAFGHFRLHMCAHDQYRLIVLHHSHYLFGSLLLFPPEDRLRCTLACVLSSVPLWPNSRSTDWRFFQDDKYDVSLGPSTESRFAPPFCEIKSRLIDPELPRRLPWISQSRSRSRAPTSTTPANSIPLPSLRGTKSASICFNCCVVLPIIHSFDFLMDSHRTDNNCCRLNTVSQSEFRLALKLLQHFRSHFTLELYQLFLVVNIARLSLYGHNEAYVIFSSPHSQEYLFAFTWFFEHLNTRTHRNTGCTRPHFCIKSSRLSSLLWPYKNVYIEWLLQNCEWE